MISGLLPIPIKELKALSNAKEWPIEGYLEELDSITPIRGNLIAEYQGETLKVKGNFSTIISLKCDSCSFDFNYPLTFNSEELIMIEEEKNSTEDLQYNELAEYISPNSSFCPERWVFEQMSLQLPLINICSNKCIGPAISKNENIRPSTLAECNDQKYIDPRLSHLKKLLNL